MRTSRIHSFLQGRNRSGRDEVNHERGDSSIYQSKKEPHYREIKYSKLKTEGPSVKDLRSEDVCPDYILYLSGAEPPSSLFGSFSDNLRCIQRAVESLTNVQSLMISLRVRCYWYLMPPKRCRGRCRVLRQTNRQMLLETAQSSHLDLSV